MKIKKFTSYSGYTGPMTIKAWPDLRTGTGEVVKNFNIFLGKVGKIFWGPRF